MKAYKLNSWTKDLKTCASWQRATGHQNQLCRVTVPLQTGHNKVCVDWMKVGPESRVSTWKWPTDAAMLEAILGTLSFCGSKLILEERGVPDEKGPKVLGTMLQNSGWEQQRDSAGWERCGLVRCLFYSSPKTRSLISVQVALPCSVGRRGVCRTTATKTKTTRTMATWLMFC